MAAKRPTHLVKTAANALQKLKLPDENPEVPKKLVFQEITRIQASDNKQIMSLAEAAVQPEGLLTVKAYYKYPGLIKTVGDEAYHIRAVDNQYTTVQKFPLITDFVVVGAGLIGSAAAYYMKRTLTRNAEVVVIDKSPYSPSNCTASCNGLISTQSKFQDVSRLAALSKEFIRTLRNDLLVTKEDFAKIKYRPCTHLILWPESEAEEVMRATDMQIDDGCFTDLKLPRELEEAFPFLKVRGSDVALGSHGNQDEALVDTVALRNLYRTLAQAYGAAFVAAEPIDFNTCYFNEASELNEESIHAFVVKLPATGELRALGFAKTILALGHDTPFLEAKAELETYRRDGIGDLHFLQPKMRLNFSFQSLMAPVIHFPVITDTDGSTLIRDDFAGDFKIYLNLEESEKFLDTDYELFVGDDEEDPHPNLYHKSLLFENYFNDVIKPRLVRRIPVMKDAKFIVAQSCYESHNVADDLPVFGLHPYHNNLLVSGGFGSRLASFGPAAGVALAELAMFEEEQTFDVTNFYWDRVLKGSSFGEFPILTQ